MLDRPTIDFQSTLDVYNIMTNNILDSDEEAFKTLNKI